MPWPSNSIFSVSFVFGFRLNMVKLPARKGQLFAKKALLLRQNKPKNEISNQFSAGYHDFRPDLGAHRQYP
jgi:hypothetical protein